MRKPRAGPRAGPLALAAMLIVSLQSCSVANASSTIVAPDQAAVATHSLVNTVVTQKNAEIFFGVGATNAACDALVSGASATQVTEGAAGVSNVANTTAWMWRTITGEANGTNNTALFMAPTTAGWQTATPQIGGQGHSANTSPTGASFAFIMGQNAQQGWQVPAAQSSQAEEKTAYIM